MDITIAGPKGGGTWHYGKYLPYGDCRLFKKNEIKPWLSKEWCIPKPSAEFVERMEDILDLYKRPYDENCPVLCLDETTRQLIGEVLAPVPVQKGQPVQYDHEYVRNGVAHLFMMFEPLAAKRYVKVGEAHTRVDFAHCLQELADVRYPNAKKIILVMDNLSTHTLAALY